MPEQPQWSERTIDMPPQDPWADPPTVHAPPPRAKQGPAAQGPAAQGPAAQGPAAQGPAAQGPAAQGPAAQGPAAQGPAAQGPAAQTPDGQPFSRGRAQVNPRPRTQQFAADHEPTGTGWPGAEPPQRRSVGWHMRELRRGGEWSFAAALFAFVCWGIWAISTDGDTDGDLTTPIVVFVLSLIVAVGLFALSRVVGRVVLEKRFHRVRRSARGSHLVAALFLVGVGVAHLRQTPWVMDAYHWVIDLI